MFPQKIAEGHCSVSHQLNSILLVIPSPMILIQLSLWRLNRHSFHHQHHHHHQLIILTPLSHHKLSFAKNVMTKLLVDKVNKLLIQTKRATRDRMFNCKNSFFTWRKIKTDAKMNFYTGIQSIAMFNVLFTAITIFAKITILEGCKTNKYTYSKVKRKAVTPRSKILTHKDEMLLTLMRIRLGLLNEGLADRFGISPSICSNTFTTWIKVLGKIFGDALVVWLPRESETTYQKYLQKQDMENVVLLLIVRKCLLKDQNLFLIIYLVRLQTS